MNVLGNLSSFWAEYEFITCFPAKRHGASADELHAKAAGIHCFVGLIKHGAEYLYRMWADCGPTECICCVIALVEEMCKRRGWRGM
jgi:hypothetical protein